MLSRELDLADALGFERTRQRRRSKAQWVILSAWPSTVLSRQTNLMYVLNYFGELNARAARQAISEGLDGADLAAPQEYLVQHPTIETSKAANDVAMHNTFQRRTQPPRPNC